MGVGLLNFNDFHMNLDGLSSSILCHRFFFGGNFGHIEYGWETVS